MCFDVKSNVTRSNVFNVVSDSSCSIDGGGAIGVIFQSKHRTLSGGKPSWSRSLL